MIEIHIKFKLRLYHVHLHKSIFSPYNSKCFTLYVRICRRITTNAYQRIATHICGDKNEYGSVPMIANYVA